MLYYNTPVHEENVAYAPNLKKNGKGEVGGEGKKKEKW